MKSLLAFMKKEWMEQVRSGRLLIRDHPKLCVNLRYGVE